MSRKGNPYDNAYVESFFKTLKYEEVYLNEYETFEDALENIGRFIDEVYNKLKNAFVARIFVAHSIRAGGKNK